MTPPVLGTDFTGGAQRPSYVDGRLLTAEDLTSDQSALRQRDALIGRAAGTGIVDGLWVTNTATTLTVAPGVGVTGVGEPLTVASAVVLPLTTVGVVAPTPAAGFCDCSGPVAAPDDSVNDGCYLLTAAPVVTRSGSVPVAAAGGGGGPGGCAAQWQIDGTRFAAVRLPLGASVAGVTVTADNRRNLLAHWCFGTEALSRLALDPFGFDPAYGGFDRLVELTGSMLPLAVFCWDGRSVGFVDNWSARRRPTTPEPETASWSAVTAERRTVDGIARFLQFQDQVDELAASAAAGRTTASDVFGLLPPVGFLPWAPQYALRLFDELSQYVDTGPDQQPQGVDEQPTTDSYAVDVELRRLARTLDPSFVALASTRLGVLGSRPGFDPRAFFANLARFGGFLEWDVADLLLRQSWERAPQPTLVDQSQEPVPSTGGPIRVGPMSRRPAGGSPSASEPDPQPMPVDRQPPPLPVTYYLVTESLTGTLAGTPPGALRPLRSRYPRKVVRQSVPPYLVFVRNYSWHDAALPPILQSAPSWNG